MAMPPITMQYLHICMFNHIVCQPILLKCRHSSVLMNDGISAMPAAPSHACLQGRFGNDVPADDASLLCTIRIEPPPHSNTSIFTQCNFTPSDTNSSLLGSFYSTASGQHTISITLSDDSPRKTDVTASQLLDDDSAGSTVIPLSAFAVELSPRAATGRDNTFGGREGRELDSRDRFWAIHHRGRGSVGQRCARGMRQLHSEAAAHSLLSCVRLSVCAEQPSHP